MKTIKKFTAVVLICFSSIFIVLCGVSIGMGTNQNEISKISYQEANYKNANEALLAEVKKVQEVAVLYKTDNPSVTASTTDLVLQYFRKDRYNTGLWAQYLSIDAAFVQRVADENAVPNIDLSDDSASLYDLNTGKEIDFIHMLATINFYKTCKSNMICNFANVHDFGGWAGDLAELTLQVANARIGGITDTNLLQKYSDSMLGTNKAGSSFSSADILADLDALVLYSLSSTNGLDNDLYGTLNSYYVTLESEANISNRIDKASAYMGASGPKAKATSLMGLSGILDMLLGTTNNSKLTEVDKEIAINSFEKYMNKVPYIEFETTSSTQIVGETKVVKVVESNLVDEVIEIEPNIAYVTRSGYEYSITPFKAGEATIKVSSKDKSVSAEYVLTAKNVAPLIKTNLLDSYDLVTKNNKEISFEVEGTNNVYTWYISDRVDGEYTVLTTTTEPKYNIDPKIDLNGKYIKCGIKNDGNAEVFTKATKLNVTENPVVDTGDLTIPIMLMIIVLVVGANLIYQKYVKTKPITNLIVK